MRVGKHCLPAVILGRTNYGESDLIVHFFTEEFGKISGLAKYGRKSRKRFGNVLSPAMLVDLDFTHTSGRDLVRLDRGELTHAFDHLGSDVHQLAWAGQALELIDGFCAPLDPAPELFKLLVWCLERLDQGLRMEEALFIFQLKLLALSGFGPNLEACGECGQPVGDQRPMHLRPEQGGVACRSCSAGGFPVSAGTIKLMTLIQSLEISKLNRVRVHAQALKETGSFPLAYIRHILGRDLKSCRFLEQIKGRRTLTR